MQKTCGKLWWKLGWIVLVPSVIIQFPFYKSDEDVIGLVGGILCTVQCVILVASVYPVEKALKKYFNKDGTRSISARYCRKNSIAIIHVKQYNVVTEEFRISCSFQQRRMSMNICEEEIKMHKEYMLSCFNLSKMEDEEDFFESIDEMKTYIEQGGEDIIVEGTYHLDEISIN